jgi:hypothetical protein
MSWLSSIAVGVLTAVVGAIVGGTIATFAADWYRIPSREGASGYYVVGFILLAIVVGFIVGLVVSRTIAGRPDPGFLKALGWSQLIMLGAIGVIGGVARLAADVGPTIGGKEVLVNVEFRWPKGQEPPPATEQWWLELASVSSHVQRNSEQGPAWREDARLEDGYWIVPAAVNLYTSRGDRTLMLRPDGILPMGYVAPIPAWPGKKDLEWTEWYPTQKKGGPPPPNEFRFRYRLVQAGSPLRTQKFGDFELTLLAESIGTVTYSGQPPAWTAYGTYAIRYRGQPLMIEGRKVDGETPARYEQARAVALIPGPQPALVVMVNAEQGYGEIMLLTAEGDSVRSEYIAHGPSVSAGKPLTNDPAVFRRIAGRYGIEGQVDTVAYSAPGLYLFMNALLDTRTRTVRHFTAERPSNPIERINPLAISPDEKSFVQFGYHPESTDTTVLYVTSTTTGETYFVPIDRYRTRYGDYDGISPLHVSHYFSWVRDKEGDDRLVERTQVKPLPYRGRTSVDPDYQEYRVYLATESLRPAIIEWMVQEFGAVPTDTTEGAFAHEVTIDGRTVNISWSKDDEHVGIWIDRGTDVSLVSTIGERFNAALESGRFDRYFKASADSAGSAD